MLKKSKAYRHIRPYFARLHVEIPILFCFVVVESSLDFRYRLLPFGGSLIDQTVDFGATAGSCR
jgi:hypothetical protein